MNVWMRPFMRRVRIMVITITIKKEKFLEIIKGSNKRGKQIIELSIMRLTVKGIPH